MSVKHHDYRVALQTERQISVSALRWRMAHGNHADNLLEIVPFMERTLLRGLSKGPYTIRFYGSPPRGDPAYVSFDPLTLHIFRKVWTNADLGQPEARRILAHEAGHLVLHDGSAQAFSSDSSVAHHPDTFEFSAEWQAHRFADHLLAPSFVVKRFSDPALLAAACGIPIDMAEQRIAAVSDEWWGTKAGEPCDRCGKLSLVDIGKDLICATEGCGRQIRRDPPHADSSIYI